MFYCNGNFWFKIYRRKYSGLRNSILDVIQGSTKATYVILNMFLI